MKKEDIIKKFTFSTEEKNILEEIDIGIMSFRQAVNGMMTNKEIVLRSIYKRVGIEKDWEGYTKNISYNLGRGELVVTYIPIPKEKNKENNDIKAKPGS